MQRRSVKQSVYNKTSSNQDLILQHMSNHYRRILNAKKAIDNSPPYCYNPRRSRINNSSKLLRCIKTSKSSINSNPSPILTDRSFSNSSYKGSCWGTESYIGNSRYHASCIPDPQPPQPKVIHIDMALIDRITYDTKNAPAVYCDKNWVEPKIQQNEKKTLKSIDLKQIQIEQKPLGNSKRRLPPREIESKQKRIFPIQRKAPQPNSTAKDQIFFPSFNRKLKSKTLKSDVTSKLRSSRVYYPPRRIKRIDSKSQGTTGECKCTDICICMGNGGYSNYKKVLEISKDNKTSSRDSAYNGGVSSLPESRSPTPDQKKEQGCLKNNNRFCEENIKNVENNTKKNSEYYQGKGNVPKSNTYPMLPKPEFNDDEGESLRKLKEDALYIKFIQDITVEVLEKHIYTNKALKKVMKKHLMQNLSKLDKDRMIKEVDNLRIQLKIPEDKSLYDFEVHASDSTTDLANNGSIISDSEFTIPENLADSLENEDLILKEEVEMSPKMSKSLIKSRSKSKSSKDNDSESLIGSEISDDLTNYMSETETEKTMEDKESIKSPRKDTSVFRSYPKESGDDSDESYKSFKKIQSPAASFVKTKKCICSSSDKKDKSKKMLGKKVSISTIDSTIDVLEEDSKICTGSTKSAATIVLQTYKKKSRKD